MHIDNCDNMATLMRSPCAEFAIHLSPFIATIKLFAYNATLIKPLNAVECSMLKRMKILEAVIGSRMNN